MEIMMPSELEIQKAVDEELNTNEWPIYKSQDDRGLEDAEYFAFACVIMRRLHLLDKQKSRRKVSKKRT